jgi:type II secretory pathway pseudopilin PulG
MAILAAAIAPALIRYIDKSRRSDDVAAAETLNTATQAALSNEDAYDERHDAQHGLCVPSASFVQIGIPAEENGCFFPAGLDDIEDSFHVAGRVG